MMLHNICNSKYFDLIIAAVIGLNVVSMSLEFYMMPKVYLIDKIKIIN
jgi:voltage-dependent calcium channel T type alpha-1G